MSVLEGFQPKEVLQYFEAICSMPHGSGNVRQISDYLMDFARERGLDCRQDQALNVIIRKAGTPGYEQAAPVIIQGHMDMVAVKTADCSKDLDTDGLDLMIRDGDWLTADGTSLGADDGIAVAYALALLDSQDIPHPPLEVVITVDEEIGMLGAEALDTSDLKGRIMLNIDSEDEGIFTVSCAGGMTSVSRLTLQTEERKGAGLRILLDGFLGGHSGEEINKGRLNALKTLGRLLDGITDPDIRLAQISGGEKDNAIAKIAEARLVLTTDSSLDMETVKAKLLTAFQEIQAEKREIEKGLQMTLIDHPQEEKTWSCMTAADTEAVIKALCQFPDGVQKMNPEIPDMVQTSLNLGLVQMAAREITFVHCIRSSLAEEKYALRDQVKAVIEGLGGSMILRGDYSGWAYRSQSPLRDLMVENYRELYGQEPVIAGIHAGLECGIFAEKLDGLDCISLGPQMHDIHTTEEELSISSVQRTWELLKLTLAKLK